MNNFFNVFKAASISGLALALLSPMSSFAESTDGAVAAQNSQNLAHRVSHSLATSRDYTHSPNAGYKWGKQTRSVDTSATWAENSPSQAGYKWSSNVEAEKAATQTYASNAGYQWGSMSFSDEAAYRWGLHSFSEQSAYRWGLRSFDEQAAYRWGLHSFSEQSAYRWGLHSYADQSAYRWGLH